jgi:serine/threonine protein kinase
VCPNDGAWLHEETIMDQQQRPRGRGNPKDDEFGPDATDRAVKPYAAVTAALPAGAPGATAIDIAAGTRVGDYAIESKIGEGAMGAVYRAVHPAIGKKVAIKVMTPKLFDEPESVKRFVAEARAIAAIRHPGIVDIFGFGKLPDGRTYLVMEWLEGATLGERLLREKVLPFVEACDLIRQIARALEAAHGKSIVHRDLKPDNVFIHHIDDEKPQCKLLDFGLAKVTNQDDAAVAKTRTGQLLGTPLYMSPEQCKAKGVDHRTDIYALGCMGYEMLCGRVPFDADNVAELISAHLVGTPPRPKQLKADLPDELDQLLFAMLAKNPDERPTLAEVRKTITSVLTKPSTPAPYAQDDITPIPDAPARPLPFGLRTGPIPVATVVPPPAAEAHELQPQLPSVAAAPRKQLPWLGIVGALVVIAIAAVLMAALL